MEKFYEILAETLDVAEIHPETVLRELPEWDSLAALSVLAMADSQFKVQLSVDDLRTITTARELEQHIATLKSAQA